MPLTSLKEEVIVVREVKQHLDLMRSVAGATEKRSSQLAHRKHTESKYNSFS